MFSKFRGRKGKAILFRKGRTSQKGKPTEDVLKRKFNTLKRTGRGKRWKLGGGGGRTGGKTQANKVVKEA